MPATFLGTLVAVTAAFAGCLLAVAAANAWPRVGAGGAQSLTPRLASYASELLDAPPCAVEREGVAGFVSTQVDLLSPRHGSTWLAGEAIPLKGEVQAWPMELAQRPDVRLCIALDGSEPACAPLTTTLPTLADLSLGAHTLTAYLALEDKTRLDCNLKEHDAIGFLVQTPKDATVLLLSELEDKAHIDGLRVKVHVFQVGLLDHLRQWVRLVDETGLVRDMKPCRGYVTSLRRMCDDLVAPSPGIYTVHCDRATSIAVHVRGETNDGLVLLTAADAAYFGRLANFVGSVHFWEPFLSVDVYDLGLGEDQLETMEQWKRVSIKETAFRQDIQLVGWKFAVLRDALARHRRVVWMDANAELRRPLTALRHSLEARGYFLTVAGHRFPTPKTVRPATLAHFGCAAPFASRTECTSAYVGVARGSPLHALLPSLDACAANRTCLYPPDAVGNTNQRRDQSVLNAALCVTPLACTADRAFWMWAGQKGFPPTEDPSDWNSLVLFSRRGQGAPYSVELVEAWTAARGAAANVPGRASAERRPSAAHFGDL